MATLYQSYVLNLRNKRREILFERKLVIYQEINARLFRIQSEFLGYFLGRGLNLDSDDTRLFRETKLSPMVNRFRAYFESRSLFLPQEVFDSLREIDLFVAVTFAKYDRPSAMAADFDRLRTRLRDLINEDLKAIKLEIALPKTPEIR